MWQQNNKKNTNTHSNGRRQHKADYKNQYANAALRSFYSTNKYMTIKFDSEAQKTLQIENKTYTLIEFDSRNWFLYLISVYVSPKKKTKWRIT